MRINGLDGIHNSNVNLDAQRMHTNEADSLKSGKDRPIRDSVEISSRSQSKSSEAQEKKSFDLRTWLEKHWKQSKEKGVEFLLKIHILNPHEVDPERVQFNPYFLAEIKRDLQSWVLFQKVKYRVHAITQSLVKWFSEFTGGSFFAKKEETKEELPKKERYGKTDINKEEETKEESVEYHIDRRV